jgi:hypothetical protein
MITRSYRAAGPVEDLFGETHEVVDKIPRRGSRGYLAYVGSLPLPDGLRFWTLGHENGLPPHASRRFVESIWCRDDQGRFVNLTIDLRTACPVSSMVAIEEERPPAWRPAAI